MSPLRPPFHARALLVALAVATGILGASRCARGDGRDYQATMSRALAQLQEADRLRRAGDVRGAGRAAREALAYIEDADRLQPGALDAPFLGVQGAAIAKDAKLTAGWLDQFTRRNAFGERNPDLHYLRGFAALVLSENPKDAIASFQRMLALNPSARAVPRDILWDEALRLEAQRLTIAQEYDAALGRLREAVRLARQRGDRRRELTARGNVGLVLQIEQRWIEADEVFAGLRRDDPTNALWQWRTGLNFASQYRWADAIPYYEETLRLLEARKEKLTEVGEMNEVHLRLANCRRNVATQTTDPKARRALVDLALAGLDRHIALLPNDVRGHYWKGTILWEMLERPYDAIPSFVRAYALDPVCDHSLRYLVQIHRQNPPPPGMTQEAWDAEGDAQQKDLDDHRKEREDIRDKRLHGSEKEVGCE